MACLENLPAKTLAQQIQKTRHYLGLTKREFAVKIVVHEKTVILWEDGRSTPSKARQTLIAELIYF
jgi:DNA-binding transcriptional regulator YiaG